MAPSWGTEEMGEIQMETRWKRSAPPEYVGPYLPLAISPPSKSLNGYLATSSTDAPGPRSKTKFNCVLVTHPQEKERPRWEGHAMRPRFQCHRFAVFEPLDLWRRAALCLAVECRGFVAGHHHVQGMLGDSWHLDGCKEKFPSIKIRLYGFFVPLNCQRVTWMEGKCRGLAPRADNEIQ